MNYLIDRPLQLKINWRFIEKWFSTAFRIGTTRAVWPMSHEVILKGHDLSIFLRSPDRTYQRPIIPSANEYYQQGNNKQLNKSSINLSQLYICPKRAQAMKY